MPETPAYVPVVFILTEKLPSRILATLIAVWLIDDDVRGTKSRHLVGPSGSHSLVSRIPRRRSKTLVTDDVQYVWADTAHEHRYHRYLVYAVSDAADRVGPAERGRFAFPVHLAAGDHRARRSFQPSRRFVEACDEQTLLTIICKTSCPR